MLRVSFAEMKAEFERVLLKTGFDRERAELCARLFAETSRDGVYTHGLNRFPGFIADIKKGRIKSDARPEKIGGFGAVESWNGNLGPGNLNATLAMSRAVELARANGMGCVALQNTNHWLRGGTYGWQAAEAGCIGICWTNTLPLMPPWGSSENKLGNNPLVLAVPHRDGHIVLDMAMTVFSMGKLNSTAAKGALLPLDGGFDEEGKVTRDPQQILKSKRPMPIGYWKGTGLALLLDLIGMMLSGGNSTFHLGQATDKPGICQVFIAFDPARLARPGYEDLIAEILADLHGAEPLAEGEPILYPGERALKVRRENLEKGIPVEENFWRQVLEM